MLRMGERDSRDAHFLQPALQLPVQQRENTHRNTVSKPNCQPPLDRGLNLGRT